MLVAHGFNRLVINFIVRSKKRAISYPLVGSSGDQNTVRWEILWPDEWWTEDGRLHNQFRWWQFFNVLLHQWKGSDTGHPHDHPRWSITILLRGEFQEEHSGKVYQRRAGNVVFRTHLYDHKITVPKNVHRKTYTLFIVGPRKWVQHYYVDGKQVPMDEFD